MKPRILSAGIIVVRYFEALPRYLCLRVYGYWDFPKGEVEPGEDPLAAAVREVREETGLEELVFHWGEDYRETTPYRGGKVARYYAAQSPRGDVVLAASRELGKPEHHEARWLEHEDARERVAERVRPALDWAHRLASGARAPGS